MIKSFASAKTEKLFNRRRVKQFQAIERPALRKLTALNAAIALGDLAAIPGNRLEKLEGDRKGQHSVCINDQYRVCFVWKDGDAYDVEVTDYH